MSAWHVDLRPHFNARAATSNDERARCGFNAWGNSFPAEELTFGEVIEVDGIPFRLERSGELDHVEADRQHIALPRTDATALALLAFGEMGPQRTRIVVEGDGEPHTIDALAAGWLVAGTFQVERALDCTHLHYPGDYELSHLRPVMWPYVYALPRSRNWRRLRIEPSPLFHFAAATLLA
ncbi:MAG TPA: hypothetical protein VFO89_16900 [Thermoanaerobaculia bacterium]|nr:hypothetical protein [Thermoanaerobaculia bacterium]